MPRPGHACTHSSLRPARPLTFCLRPYSPARYRRRTSLNRPPAVADLVHRAAQSYGAKKAQRTMGLKFPGDEVPSLQEFTEAAQRLGIAVIRLTPAR